MRFLALIVLLLAVAPSAWADKAAPAPAQPAPKVSAESLNASSIGWMQLKNGDFAAAEKSFNKAVGIDKRNAEAEWGLGLVAGQKSKDVSVSDLKQSEEYLRQSIAHLETARAAGPSPRILTDTAFSYTMLGAELKHDAGGDDGNFDRARALYKIIESMGPPAPQLYENWALLEMYSGNTPEARRIWAKAKDLGAEDSAFEKSLDNSEGK